MKELVVEARIKMHIKQIKNEGPLFRYETDIWCFDNQLKTNNNHEYCFDIIEYFSKWLYCYLLTDKTMMLVA